MALIERYLRHPGRQPDYRRQRSHADFLCNIPLNAASLRLRLRQVWDASEGAAPPLQRVQELAERKYNCDDWIRKR
jgi:hypothetical protein